MERQGFRTDHNPALDDLSPIAALEGLEQLNLFGESSRRRD